jgi:DNA-binding transcriptional regulator YiaG
VGFYVTQFIFTRSLSLLRRLVDMRIRMTADKKYFFGTPIDIVQGMRNTDYRTYDSLGDYIRECVIRGKVLGERIQVNGQSDEELSFSYLRALLEKGHAKVVVTSPADVDRYTVAVLREVLGISQEELARRVGVAFTTVNRWERGKARPASAAIAHTVSRLAKKART